MATESRFDGTLVCWSIRVRGTVQGVGFRPTVFKLANEHRIKGSVLNDGEGVLIEAWADDAGLARFVQAIRDNCPPLATIFSIEHTALSSADLPGGAVVPADFVITKSSGNSADTQISPDAATCAACLEDSFNPVGRRFRYPFTNCTHCGPRLSIIKSIPYDRAATSMSVFKMCSLCQAEYDNPDDRRFHAQPNACPACGPRAWLESADGHVLGFEELSQLDFVDAAASLLLQGKIVAIKGIGGFHLACDATNEETVAELRRRKNRYHKPFALMARDLAVLEEYCTVNKIERQQLQSHGAPIVVLERRDGGISSRPIAASVAPGQKTLGFMLPYTPLHHLLLERITTPIVLTSGNVSHEPQCICNKDVKARLSTIADYFLLHNRDIVNRLDDSVVRVVSGGPVYLRRARGAAPVPVNLPEGFEGAPDLLALGGELKSTFCLGKNARAIISQHIGDLEDARTYADYQHNLALYSECFKHQPTAIVVDLHPEYLSSKLGRRLAQDKNLSLIEVQHHHAHIAAVLADNRWSLHAGPVLGVALDGLGFGNDGTIWGGEFLLADYTSFERLACFKPVALLGGSKAMYEPWRNTYAHIVAGMGWQSYKANFEELELTRFFQSKPLATFDSMLKTGTNSPLSSSCGRLFDAVAAAVGICREHAGYEGQAAIELEAVVDRNSLFNESEEIVYDFTLSAADNGLAHIDSFTLWPALFNDLSRKTDVGVIAARFHKGLARAIVQMVSRLSTVHHERWINTIALSGGVFQNKILLELVQSRLSAEGFKVLTHQQVPANDGGIALGQVVVGAASQILKDKERSHVSWHTWANS